MLSLIGRWESFTAEYLIGKDQIVFPEFSVGRGVDDADIMIF